MESLITLTCRKTVRTSILCVSTITIIFAVVIIFCNGARFSWFFIRLWWRSIVFRFCRRISPCMDWKNLKHVKYQFCNINYQNCYMEIPYYNIKYIKIKNEVCLQFSVMILSTLPTKYDYVKLFYCACIELHIKY